MAIRGRRSASSDADRPPVWSAGRTTAIPRHETTVGPSRPDGSAGCRDRRALPAVRPVRRSWCCASCSPPRAQSPPRFTASATNPSQLVVGLAAQRGLVEHGPEWGPPGAVRMAWRRLRSATRCSTSAASVCTSWVLQFTPGGRARDRRTRHLGFRRGRPRSPRACTPMSGRRDAASCAARCPHLRVRRVPRSCRWGCRLCFCATPTRELQMHVQMFTHRHLRMHGRTDTIVLRPA